MNDHIVRKIFFNTFLVQTMSVLASLISATVNGMVTGSLLGVTPMAAYGFVTPMINVYMALGGACGTGISTVCGRIVGEGDVKKTNKVFSIGMEFTLLLSVAVMLITIFCAKPLAIMFGATGDTLPMAVDFLRGYGLCAPAMFLVTTLIAVLQIDGDMKLVFASTITMTVVDVVLAVLNGLVFHKGLLGMALAVTFSFYAALVVIMLHFLNKNRILHFSLTKLNGYCQIWHALCHAAIMPGIPCDIFKLCHPFPRKHGRRRRTHRRYLCRKPLYDDRDRYRKSCHTGGQCLPRRKGQNLHHDAA